jgi:L-ascorbate metabolism protein UlaG (beta-lactamase superfamily)
MPTLTYLGHSAFSIVCSKGKVLIDPFLDGNPKAAIKAKEAKADIILVTHAHGDHLGDAISIAKRTGATIVGMFELANYCSERGAKVIDAHFGGTVELPMGRAKLFHAIHSSCTDDGVCLGDAASFVLEADDARIYHAGDTALFGDMRLIGEEFCLDVALLPIGGHYTMGIKDAVRAVKLLRPLTVIPMHYATYSHIDVDPLEFKRLVESETRTECEILKPGESLAIEGRCEPRKGES